MLQQINALGTIDPRIEMHYRFYQKIDPSQYPHVHDFYEIMLITDGKMELNINHKTELLGAGALFLIRPGDVHTRKAADTCSYFNLAFLSEVVEKMFRYLDMPEMIQYILRLPCPPSTGLTSGETLLLKGWLEKLAEQMEQPDCFSCTLGELAAMSSCAKEHLCRSFKKEFGTSPLNYRASEQKKSFPFHISILTRIRYNDILFMRHIWHKAIYR